MTKLLTDSARQCDGQDSIIVYQYARQVTWWNYQDGASDTTHLWTA